MTRIVGALCALSFIIVTSACAVIPGGGGAMKVTTYFADSAGLFVGNDVGVLGVPVGKIESIEPVGDRVKVVMTLDSSVPVPADAGAVVTARSVATDRYIELVPVYSQGPKMADGAEIPQDRTRTPVDFDAVLATLSKFSKEITGSKETTGAIKEFLRVGADTLDGNGELIQGSVKSLSAAVDAVSSQRGNVVATLGSLDILVRELAANEKTIRSFTRSVARASKLLADESGNLETALATLQDSITVVAEFARTHRQQLMGSVNKLTEVIEIILRSQRDLKEMVEVFPLALQNLDRAVVDGRVNARMSPAYLTPLGSELQAVCQQLGQALCDNFGITPELPLTDLLDGLLRGVESR